MLCRARAGAGKYALSALKDVGSSSDTLVAWATTCPCGPLLSKMRWMSLRASEAVKTWVSKQDPALFKPSQSETGRLHSPRLSRRNQSLRIKAAIKNGEISLEPTVMPVPTRFKGHKRERDQPVRQALIERKMQEMPKLIAEFKEARATARAKRRADARFK
uniref:Large ribosomal subunit protein mL59 domain-containing protein n=1 Tax=Calcidiscus leptoporus TaxID=127549 RepID=A0A7S0JHG5_9EUKA|mmetsp:Transcript_56809/g.130460  ORF Transcript_56809/g.130460 Transcript_56809/m.130460 type:complete len:161 (+) Transcript_56809:49-531(+)